MGARYLTTTLPYVNADPHIGFALEILQADVLVRAWRLKGEEVFFTTGTDEHGQKIFEAAKKANQDVQTYVDHYARRFEDLDIQLGLDKHAFIRTTDPAHVAAAERMWELCAAKGDIYLKEYEGLYCVGHEAFITEKDLVDGKCPEHGKEPEKFKEKNYFFKFSKYQNDLLAYLSRENSIVPDWRRLEAINFVKAGLEDFSISREKERLSWGIPVPGDDSQVMYVWFDALTNYISTLGWPDDKEGNFKKFWERGTVLQLAGKDQVRFQSLMWQAMLMSAGVKNTDTVFYHGFINSGGHKMSKSLGNVINPYDLVKKYGTDATRYLLLRHVHPTEDTDVTWEKLDEWYTANLTNGLGNLVARVMKLAETHLKSAVAPIGVDEFTKNVTTDINSFAFSGALDLIFARISAADERITKEKPFEVIKSSKEEGEHMIASLVTEVALIAENLAAYMPSISQRILSAVRENKKPENLFPRL